MFLIQSVKTKRYYQYNYYQRLSYTDYLSSAKVFDSPQAASDFIAANCSKTSRSHVVYYDGNQVWNVSPAKSA